MNAVLKRSCPASPVSSVEAGSLTKSLLSSSRWSRFLKSSIRVYQRTQMSLLSCDALARALSCTLDTDLETAAVPVISARSGDRQLWKYLNLEDFRVLVDRYYKALADGRLHRSGEPDVIRRATDVVQIVINALPEPDNHTG